MGSNLYHIRSEPVQVPLLNKVTVVIVINGADS